jgi:hypothetical protein
MTELVAVESLVLAAAAHHPELGKQIEALGKGVLLRICEVAVQDPEPNAARADQLDFGQSLAAPSPVVKTVFETAVLARIALEIVKTSLADPERLAEQLRVERERRALNGLTDAYAKAVATAAVEARGSDQRTSPA